MGASARRLGRGDQAVRFPCFPLSGAVHSLSNIEHLINHVFQVILSIENHLNTEQQDTMAIMMKDIFGNLLYTEEVRILNVTT